jgi:hypothetical protein
MGATTDVVSVCFRPTRRSSSPARHELPLQVPTSVSYFPGSAAGPATRHPSEATIAAELPYKKTARETGTPPELAEESIKRQCMKSTWRSPKPWGSSMPLTMRYAQFHCVANVIVRITCLLRNDAPLMDAPSIPCGRVVAVVFVRVKYATNPFVSGTGKITVSRAKQRLLASVDFVSMRRMERHI